MTISTGRLWRRRRRPVSRTAGGRRLGALFAVLGLLFHAALPFLHPSMAAAASSTLDGALLVVCTPSGLAALPAAGGGDPGDTASKPLAQATILCPICSAAQASATFLPPPAIDLGSPIRAVAATTWHTRPADTVRARPSAFDAPPRAPPAQAA